ncbi:hypothetical protein CKN80_02645 [Carnobacterium divergens]|uniref:DEAD/DEAH box helicase n=1 Tax=Carnobacterium divergens TaxID=2748 RepID=UPI001072708D|nr:DEAD/DEAH box helicase [Carnobacterium divergens]TFJ46657.1 hypothetical protein CKN79_02645 [Carnobacterium divergens]TFJ53620.1 hypothetical protein CKN80_02645 [Carnobacterium divergens]
MGVSLPDKDSVADQLAKYREHMTIITRYQNQINELKNIFNDTFYELTSPQKNLSKIQSNLFYDQKNNLLNFSHEVYQHGLFVLQDIAKDKVLKHNLEIAFSLYQNQDKFNTFDEEIGNLKLERSIPEEPKGKIRGFFSTKQGKEEYLQQVDNLIDINKILRESDLSNSINKYEIIVHVPLEKLKAIINEDFDKIQDIYQGICGFSLANPKLVPPLEELLEQLNYLYLFNEETKKLSIKYEKVINDIKNLSSEFANEILVQRFENFPLKDFIDAYPGLPVTILTQSFNNMKELEHYDGRFDVLDGVGPKKSEVIQNALDSFRRKLAANPVYKIDPHHITNIQHRLIKSLYIVVENQQLFNQLEKFIKVTDELPLQKVITKKQILLLWIKCSLDSNLDLFEDFKRKVSDGYELAEHIKQKYYPFKIDINFLEDQNVTSWFQGNAASSYAVLEKFGGIISPDNSGTSEIAKNILDKMTKIDLNFSKLKASLRGWQNFAVRYTLVQQKVLIGDEMGLGKTLEAIGVISHLAIKDSSLFLVVCPASIIVNWEREIKKHSELNSYRLHGASRDSWTKLWIDKGGVGITTFETLQRLQFPEELKLKLLIVDEAHYVKNHLAKRSKTVNSIAKRTPYVMYMTGTPIENNVEEMTSLIKVLQPNIAENIISEDFYTNPLKYREAIAPVYLRRKKEDVLNELPPLTQVEEWVSFGNGEKELYRQAVADGKFMLMRRCGWMGKSIEYSPKKIRLLEICDEARENGEKIIVFSFFRSVIDAVIDILGDRALPPIMGGVSTSSRQKILDDFEQAPAGAVLPAQVLAAGFGLNIQAASIIIFCEPQNKPSIETQAIARAYRMGQTNPVFVYRLLTEESVDEPMMEMLDSKQQVFDNFAKDSFISNQTSQSVDISDTAIVKRIIREERERLKLDTDKSIILKEE